MKRNLLAPSIFILFCCIAIINTCINSRNHSQNLNINNIALSELIKSLPIAKPLIYKLPTSISLNKSYYIKTSNYIDHTAIKLLV